MGPDILQDLSIWHASPTHTVYFRIHQATHFSPRISLRVARGRSLVERRLDASEPNSTSAPLAPASMVNFYVFNPAQKLRFLSGIIYKGSKRLLRNIRAQQPATPVDEQPRPIKFNIHDLIKTDLRHAAQGVLKRDREFYKDDSESGFCVFRVEDTLFKVHKCYLLREPSAFGDMFGLPFISNGNEGQSDEAAIPLSDTAEQFRDLLWVLYAIPTQLCSTTQEDGPSIERLLNIARLTNKYCIASYEAWSLQRLFTLAQDPAGFLRYAPSETCADALDVSFLCGQQELLEVITQRLVARMLWSGMDRNPILKVAESRGLTKLQGVAYYKELVDLDCMARGDRSGWSTPETGFTVPNGYANEEKRHQLLEAHHSLVELWESIGTRPPTFSLPHANDMCESPLSLGCASHEECLATWKQLWVGAASAGLTLRHGPADVLGRLKSMMILLKREMMLSEGISLGCTLAALESITTLREEIVSGLTGHFQV
ncbi:unnamed protein product [Cyclocybe aegerita]|uniref:BTB domain-containing protein n=1 Tax=Cyclocybe aegerita TaxID=1973307 RepID=A0A8S0WI88_CYCAE|nr:unnamed protein product [Cyclocybe aegerita]